MSKTSTIEPDSSSSTCFPPAYNSLAALPRQPHQAKIQGRTCCSPSHFCPALNLIHSPQFQSAASRFPIDESSTKADDSRDVNKPALRARPVFACWAINLATLAILAFWIYRDGQFPDVASWMKHELLSVFSAGPAVGEDAELAPRVVYLLGLMVCAAISLMGVIVGLFFGGVAHRSIRAWLLATALIAAWLALFVSWPELAWRGQAHRLSNALPKFTSKVETLTRNWPTADGDLPGLGPFLAYPLERPEVLLLLTQATLEGSALKFSAVERSDVGTLRFQLTGDETGSWLERHPASDEPRGFIGGLLQQFTLDRFTKLGENWYLVRYK